MTSKVDMSLDDIIKTNGTRGDRRGRGGPRTGRGRGRGASTATSQRARPRGARSATGFRSQRGNINGRWSHDMYYGGISTARSVSSGVTKLNITNLEYGVSDSDIKELFAEFGNMRTAAVHYDRSGRSLGTAHVIFEKSFDALKAIKQYNGVHLDGRPMRVTIEGESAAVSVAALTGSFRSRGGGRNVKRLRGGPRPIGGGVSGRGRGRVGGRGRGRGGRSTRGGRGKQIVPTAKELDKELDEYIFQTSK